MTDTRSWLAQKLGGAHVPPQYQQPQYQPQPYQQQPVYPQAFVPQGPPQLTPEQIAQIQAAQALLASYGQQTAVPGVMQPQPQVQFIVDPYAGIDNEQLKEMWRRGEVKGHQVAARFRGNSRDGAARYEPGTCPECGDSRFFDRDVISNNSVQGDVQHRGVKKMKIKPAAICMACGYNEAFDHAPLPMAAG